MPPQEEKNLFWIYLILDNYDVITIKIDEEEMDEVFKLIGNALRTGDDFSGNGMCEMTLKNGEIIEHIAFRRVIGYRT
jgi:hypothetical protein